MVALEVFKDMIETQDKVQALRLAGQDAKFDALRAERLEAKFNELMGAMARPEQLETVDALISAGLLPVELRTYMDEFDGTFGSFRTDHRRLAADLINKLTPPVAPRDALDLVAHTLRHMGTGRDDFYRTMEEVKKILKIGR